MKVPESRAEFPVRLSHLLRHCSVGAIVRGPDSLVTVTDTSRWYFGAAPPADTEIHHVRQVRAALGIEERLYAPPSATMSADGQTGTGTPIPVLRFPTWMRCTKCGLLARRPWKRSGPDTPAGCDGAAGEGGRCGSRLEHAPWVLVHEDGHMADVPWHSVAHSRAANPGQKACRYTPDRPYLKLVDERGRRKVVCTRCRARAELGSRFPFPAWAPSQPWSRRPIETRLDEPAWLVETTDARVHSACLRTAVVIPPESRIRSGSVVDRLYTSTARLEELERSKTRLVRNQSVRRLARDLRCRPEEIEDAYRQIKDGYPFIEWDPQVPEPLRGEYAALTQPVGDFREDEDFVTVHHTPNWRRLGAAQRGAARTAVLAVDQLVAVKRLKEIAVLTGFRRMGGSTVVPPDLSGESAWLPALAMRGEGLFFTLQEAMLQAWEAAEAPLVRRTQRMLRLLADRSVHHLISGSDVNPRFVLLHTLAHLLIRRLEAEAGYPAASLNERIYCSSGDAPMAGILVYIAVPDELGSLGGLFELAEPRQFLRILLAALESASWCSLDPICSEHEGQGPGRLNRAACQGCALVPDTSCLYGNVLLDRTFLKGNRTRGVRPLLSYAEG